MERLGFGMHLLVLAALVVNLWFGGELIEAWIGHLARAAFEVLLILGYLVLVLGMRAPLPGRRRDR